MVKKKEETSKCIESKISNNINRYIDAVYIWHGFIWSMQQLWRSITWLPSTTNTKNKRKEEEEQLRLELLQHVGLLHKVRVLSKITQTIYKGKKKINCPHSNSKYRPSWRSFCCEFRGIRPSAAGRLTPPDSERGCLRLWLSIMLLSVGPIRRLPDGGAAWGMKANHLEWNLMVKQWEKHPCGSLVAEERNEIPSQFQFHKRQSGAWTSF